MHKSLAYLLLHLVFYKELKGNKCLLKLTRESYSNNNEFKLRILVHLLKTKESNI